MSKGSLTLESSLYKFFKTMRKGNASKPLKFHVPKYGYEFYCRLNEDDFKLMSLHEDEILDQFNPKPGNTVVDVGAHIGLYTLIAKEGWSKWKGNCN